jgi:hypothetical protein
MGQAYAPDEGDPLLFVCCGDPVLRAEGTS